MKKQTCIWRTLWQRCETDEHEKDNYGNYENYDNDEPYEHDGSYEPDEHEDDDN